MENTPGTTVMRRGCVDSYGLITYFLIYLALCLSSECVVHADVRTSPNNCTGSTRLDVCAKNRPLSQRRPKKTPTTKSAHNNHLKLSPSLVNSISFPRQCTKTLTSSCRPSLPPYDHHRQTFVEKSYHLTKS